MRVLEVREPFGIDSVVFTTRPDPAAGPRHVVVRLNALSLNYRDHLVIDGIVRWRPREPGIPVCDGASVVGATGSAVTRFKKEDRVAPILLVSQRHQGIDPRRTSSGDVTGEERC